MSKYRIGVDVGGTFTKAVVIDDATREVVGKASVLTTHHHVDGVAAGVVSVFRQALRQTAIDPSSVVFLAHSTTQATNALLEGDVAHVGIVGMSPPETAQLAAQHCMISAIDLGNDRAIQTSNRFLTLKGSYEARARTAVAELIAEGATVIVASAAFGVDNAGPERLIQQIAGELGIACTCGNDLSRLHGLSNRTRTAVLNASILPRMIATADMTEMSVRSSSIAAPLLIMRGDGGAMALSEMRERPALTMLSGPAASVAGAIFYHGVSDGIYFEVGGTSTNIGVIKDGRPVLAHARIGGHATYVASLDIRLLGIGGGSLIRIDGDNLRVGPRSAHIAGLPYASFAKDEDFSDARLVFVGASADEEARFVSVETNAGKRYALTITCAANALGIIAPDAHCYGSAHAAKAAFEPLAAYLGRDIRDVAASVIENAKDAIHPVICELLRQHRLDVSTTTLFGAGGGAGALLPGAAKRSGLRYEMLRDSEVISSIGAALAMVREVIERIVIDPSPDDIAAIRSDALAAATKMGVDRKTTEISIEVDRQHNILRAIATGAAAFEQSAAPTTGKNHPREMARA